MNNSKNKQKLAIEILAEIEATEKLTPTKYVKIVSKYNNNDGKIIKKSELLEIYKDLVNKEEIEKSENIEKALYTKPIRSISGVVPVTVLTKPYPCPGKCIFCPTDYRMPKSYLKDEPGAMRAERLEFDPYEQTKRRIEVFERNGHDATKVELLILGGTWSAYELDYQEWFIKRCFEGMNGVDSKSLEDAQKLNEEANHRCVGLVIETRPDHINEAEIIRLRKYGVTKVQIGIQSLRDEVLELNHRGETQDDIKNAIKLLRLAGFKIHAHFMPNLLGATLETDEEDYKKLWEDNSYMPDELKIYPCSILKNAELYEYYKRGEFKPYTREELIELIAKIKPLTPKYARLSRIIRDIPSINIVAGNKNTNLRQEVHKYMKENATKCNCIRCREIKDDVYDELEVREEIIEYKTDYSKEYFISMVTEDDRLLGFLRLTIPNQKYRNDHFIKELRNSSIIREVHVYGKALKLHDIEGVQHQGFGKRLIKIAEKITIEHEINKISVISAVGTRSYYKKLGFDISGLYMSKEIKS